MNSPAKGLKKQVFGGVLLCLGAAIALLARIVGFELDVFYILISIAGAGLFLHGAMQNRRHPPAGRKIPARGD